MDDNIITISVNDIRLEAELGTSATAVKILEALPFESTVNTWATRSISPYRLPCNRSLMHGRKLKSGNSPTGPWERHSVFFSVPHQ
jgi:hypothetical protein